MGYPVKTMLDEIVFSLLYLLNDQSITNRQLDMVFDYAVKKSKIKVNVFGSMSPKL